MRTLDRQFARLDLHHPDVGIEALFPLEALLDRAGILACVERQEQPFVRPGAVVAGLRGRPEQGGLAEPAAAQHENGAGFAGAALHDRGETARAEHPPDQSGHEEVGGQAHEAGTGGRGSAANADGIATTSVMTGSNAHGSHGLAAR